MYQRPNGYESGLEQLFKQGSQSSLDLFNTLALTAFRHQYDHNPVYQNWCNLRKVNPSLVQSIDAIPFLPISVYKTQTVACFKVCENEVFLSSQTTGEHPSRHYIYELEWYHRQVKRCFEFALGDLNQFNWIALLPHYMERTGSSLISMCRELMRQCGQNGDDFFMKADPDFKHRFEQLQKSSKITLVLGVRFAFMEWINAFDFGSEVILIETGGMKNRGKDLSRQAFINLLQDKTRASAIYSEYGMTELFSQCYAKNREPFKCPPSMRVLVRSESNPNIRYSTSKSGAMDIIDLANIDTCSFIATDAVAELYPDGTFEILGRLDHSGTRGCHALWTESVHT